MTSIASPMPVSGSSSSWRDRISSAVQDGSLSEIEVAWADHLGDTLGKRFPAAGFLERAGMSTLAFVTIAELGRGGERPRRGPSVGGKRGSRPFTPCPTFHVPFFSRGVRRSARW